MAAELRSLGLADLGDRDGINVCERLCGDWQVQPWPPACGCWVLPGGFWRSCAPGGSIAAAARARVILGVLKAQPL